LEVGWAIGLKYTDGFSKLVPSVLTGISLTGSIYLLALAARVIPIGTAYPVWVGIGALGAATLGVVLLEEPVSLLRGLFIAMLVGSIIGIKLTSAI
jgi:quaternary ammonium compound-resistance protein SugE